MRPRKREAPVRASSTPDIDRPLSGEGALNAMTVLGDRIERWCQEESLSVVVEQDDEAGLACTVSLPGEPSLSVSVRASGQQPSRLLLACTFDLPVQPEMAADPEGPQRIAMLLERVAASRSGLVECHPSRPDGKPAEVVVIILHEDGLNKQSFLTALTRTEEGHPQSSPGSWKGCPRVQRFCLRCKPSLSRRALLPRVAKTGREADTPASAPAATVTPAPAPPPAPAAPAPAAAPSRFCPSCGRQAQPQQRFCTGCGATLEG